MIEKACSRCKVVKPVEAFGKNRKERDSLTRDCRVCRNALKMLHYYANREKQIAAARAWNIRNADAVRANKRARYQMDKVRQCAISRENYSRNREKINAENAAWRKANPAKCAEIKARRRAAKLQRTPPWLSPSQKEEIFNCYRTAREMSLMMLEPFHVDHIVPLQGDLVCGLHVPWNLDVVRGAENNQKYNKMPEWLEGWRSPEGALIFS